MMRSLPVTHSPTCRCRGTLFLVLAAAALTAAAPAPGGAQPPPPAVRVTEEKPGLRRQARISPDSAQAIARRRVPGGRVTKAELEREHGTLIYSFDLAVPGRRGVEEVHVDARTGAVLGVEHEEGGPMSPVGPRR